MGDWQDIFGPDTSAEDVIDSFEANPWEYIYTSQDRRLFFQSYLAMETWERRNKGATFHRRPLGDGYEVELTGKVTEKDSGEFQQVTNYSTPFKLAMPSSIHDRIKYHASYAPAKFLSAHENNSFSLSVVSDGIAFRALRGLCSFMRPDRFCRWPAHLEHQDLVDFRNKTGLFHLRETFDLTLLQDRKALALVAEDGTAILGTVSHDNSVALQPWIFDIDFNQILKNQDGDGSTTLEQLTALSKSRSDLRFLSHDVIEWIRKLEQTTKTLSTSVLPPALSATKVEVSTVVAERLTRLVCKIEGQLQSIIAGHDHDLTYGRQSERSATVELIIKPLTFLQTSEPDLQITFKVLLTYDDNTCLDQQWGHRDPEELELERQCSRLFAGQTSIGWSDVFTVQHAVWGTNAGVQEYLSVSQAGPKTLLFTA